MPIATCNLESWDTRIWGILIPPLLVALWCVVFVAVLRRTEQRDRLAVLLLFFACAAIGAVVFFPHLGASGKGAYFTSFQISLAASAAVGFLFSLVHPRISWVRAVAMAVVGDVVPAGAALLTFVWLLSLGGKCLD